MKETVLSGCAFALHKLDEPHPTLGSTWRLVVIDGQVDENGTIVEGSGSGDIYSVMFDDAAVATIHQQSEPASRIVVPGLVPVTIDPRKPVKSK